MRVSNLTTGMRSVRGTGRQSWASNASLLGHAAHIGEQFTGDREQRTKARCAYLAPLIGPADVEETPTVVYNFHGDEAVETVESLTKNQITWRKKTAHLTKKHGAHGVPRRVLIAWAGCGSIRCGWVRGECFDRTANSDGSRSDRNKVFNAGK